MRQRRAMLEEELRKAELIKLKLEELRNLRDSYPPGHDMYETIDPMHVDKVLERVEDQIGDLKRSLGHS